MANVKIIKSFGTDALVKLYQEVLAKTDNDLFETNADACIPVIICETREDLKRNGAFCPYEFVFSRQDLLAKWDCRSDKLILGTDIVKQRIAFLMKLYPHGIRLEEIKDWFAGTFRKYIFLDDRVHGTSGVIDLDNLEDDSIINGAVASQITNDDAKTLRARFVGKEPWNGDSMWQCQGLLAKLFQTYFKDKCESGDMSFVYAFSGTSPFTIGGVWNNSREYLIDIYRSNNLPRPCGDRSKFVTPTGKLNVLLIDDKPEKSPLYLVAKMAWADSRINEVNDRLQKINSDTDERTVLKEELIKLEERRKGLLGALRKMKFGDTLVDGNGALIGDGELLGKLFHVQELVIAEQSGFDVYEEASKQFRRCQDLGLTFDFALVDLCLKDQAGGDLSGYTMIKRVRQYFPHMPVIVYSKFRDMGHIARAFKCGATWFLRKGEEDKLPRHILSVLRPTGWHREWNAIKSGSDAPKFIYEKPDTVFADRFEHTREWQYLAYKSLEYFPGNFVFIRQMGGGISTACTFKATKGIKLDGSFLQAPSIVKIDTAHNTTMEYERYFRMIRPYIANEVGRIEQPERVLNRKYSSIVYTFAGKLDSAHELEAMSGLIEQDILYRSSCDYEKYRMAFDCIFDEILPKLHRVSPEREFNEFLEPEVYSAIEGKGNEKRGSGGSKERRSAFPNKFFGEVAPVEFHRSYIARMQPWKLVKLEESAVFVDQPLIGEDERRKVLRCYAFHNVAWDDQTGRGFLEAYDKEQHLVWIQGNIADHVARFRRQVFSGETLWIEENDIKKDKDSDYRGNWLDERVETAVNDHVRHCADAENLKKGNMLSEDAETDKDLKTFCKECLETFEAFFGVKSNGEKSLEHLKDLTKKHFIEIEDDVLKIAEHAWSNEWRGCVFKSPVGIVHGDMNFGNIMLELRKCLPDEKCPDITRKVEGAWLIDFARTRRDIIAHDFNVLFTATIALMFDKTLLEQREYEVALRKHFVDMVRKAITSDAKSLQSVPDAIKDDERFVFIYKVLRRIRAAALKAGVSQDMYELTTALCCLYTFKIYLNHGGRIRLAIGLVAIANIGLKSLKSRIMGLKKP